MECALLHQIFKIFLHKKRADIWKKRKGNGLFFYRRFIFSKRSLSFVSSDTQWITGQASSGMMEKLKFLDQKKKHKLLVLNGRPPKAKRRTSWGALVVYYINLG